MKKKIFASFSLSLLTALFTTSLVAAQGQYAQGSVGVDMSWPNCSASVSKVSFGIVGVSNGTGYSTNPCLASEAAHFNNLSLYVNTGWPGTSSVNNNPTSPKQCADGDLNCLAYNYGYNAGLYAVAAANTANVHSTTWWLDVETMNSWSSDALQNQNSLQGEYDALIANGALTVGAYSTTAQWDSITGGWQNNWPSWGATTWTTAKQAAKYCTDHEFTGGPSYLMQFAPKRSQLDQDVAC